MSPSSSDTCSDREKQKQPHSPGNGAAGHGGSTGGQPTEGLGPGRPGHGGSTGGQPTEGPGPGRPAKHLVPFLPNSPIRPAGGVGWVFLSRLFLLPGSRHWPEVLRGAPVGVPQPGDILCRDKKKGTRQRMGGPPPAQGAENSTPSCTGAAEGPSHRPQHHLPPPLASSQNKAAREGLTELTSLLPG